MQAERGGIQAVPRRVIQLRRQSLGGVGEFDRIGGMSFSLRFHPLRNFVPMHGNFVRRFNAEPHFIAGDSEDLDTNAESGKDDFVVTTAGQNEHDKTPY